MNETARNDDSTNEKTPASTLLLTSLPSLLLIVGSSLLFRRWSRGYWDLSNAASLSFAVIVMAVVISAFKSRQLTIRFALLITTLLAFSFAGFKHSHEYDLRRAKHLSDIEQSLEEIVGADSVFVQRNGAVTCLANNSAFDDAQLQRVLTVIDQSDAVHLYFLALYSSNTNDNTLKILGKRPWLKTLHFDGRLVSYNATNEFCKLNPSCKIDTNVVAQSAQEGSPQSPLQSLAPATASDDESR